MPPTKVKKLAVIGAGFMGASVGYVSARAGIDVVLIDRDQASADKGKAHAQGVIDDLDQEGPRQGERSRRHHVAHHARPPITTRSKDCDLVIEAVFEDRKVKAETYAKAQPLLKRGAIFASNTSTLPINSLAEEFKDQGKFIGIHFFSPVEKMMLVEIILGKNTGDVALATALDYVALIGKTPIVVERLPRLLRQPLRRPLHRRRQRDVPRRRAAGDDREHRQDGRHAGRAAVAVG